MKRLIPRSTAIACIFLVCLACAAYAAPEADTLVWSELPPLPDSPGIGGPFAGTSNGALIVAGGANFPESEWGAGEKVWRDGVYVLEPEAAEWITGYSLPRPAAYGVSVTTPHGLVCAGGSDAESALSEAWLLRWENGGLVTVRLPDLPEARAAACGGYLDGAVYVVCGQTETAETGVTRTVFRLSLPGEVGASFPGDIAWERLPDFPGEPRAQAIAAVQQGALYVVSGFTLEPGAVGQPKRRYLTDAWRFEPGEGWRESPPPPRALAAGTAIDYGDSFILCFSGHDGENDTLVQTLKGSWPGFKPDVFSFHVITGTWTNLGGMPRGIATTTAVRWNGLVAVPSGEIRPRVRTNRVQALEILPRRRGFSTLNTAMLVVYLAALVGMGVYFSRREKTTSDFFIGGHRIPWWAAGLSIFATQLSSISFMAVPAKVFATDWTYFVGYVCIVLVQPIVIAWYLPFFRRLDITSAYEYLERRFNLAARMLGSASFILFQLGRMTIVLFLPALALSAVTGISIHLCILAMGVLATVYTVLGGIEAVIWTDVLQVFVLVGGAIASLAIIAFKVDGGIPQIISMGMEAEKFTVARFSWDYTAPVLWVIFVGGMFQNMVSYSADQAVIQRYLTTRDEKTAARAIWTNGVMILPSALIFFTVGSALYAFYKTHPAFLDPTLKTDQIFPLFIAQQLPDGIVGLVIAGLFAASMSTVDSSLNSISTVIVTDFIRRFRGTGISEGTFLLIARAITVILGVTATSVALWMAANENIMSLWDVYLAVLGLIMGSLTGLFMLGIFTRRTHGPGAIIGAFGGALVLFLAQRFTALHFYMYAAVGIMACFVIGYAASILIPSREKDITGLTIHTVLKARR